MGPTKLNDVIPMLLCDNVPESLAFYTEVLGFEIVSRFDDIGKTGWASIRNGTVQLMLASPDQKPAPVKVDGQYPQMIFYFYPADVVALRESVLAKGCNASELRVTFYGMKEFDMLDPSGHVLWFGQETDEDQTVLE